MGTKKNGGGSSKKGSGSSKKKVASPKVANKQANKLKRRKNEAIAGDLAVKKQSRLKKMEKRENDREHSNKKKQEQGSKTSKKKQKKRGGGEEEEDNVVPESKKKPQQYKLPEERLPIKSADGRWVAPAEDYDDYPDDDDEGGDMPQDGGDEGEDEGDDDHTSKKQKHQKHQQPQIPQDYATMEKQRKYRVDRLKIEIAELCETLLENPEKNVAKMAELHALCQDGDLEVQQYAVLSEAEVFKDILPDYRIQVLSEEEERLTGGGKMVSKEVVRVRMYEKQLLKHYETYVHYLQAKLRETSNRRRKPKSKKGNKNQNGGGNDGGDDGDEAAQEERGERKKAREVALSKLDLVVTRALCVLMERGWNFNYRKEVIETTVPLLDSPYPAVRTMALAAFTRMATSDLAGESTLAAVRIITRTVKKKGHKVKKEVLESLLKLPLSREIIEHKDHSHSKDNKKSSKKNRLTKEQEQELEQDLNAANAEVPIAIRKKTQAAMLTEIFVVYFQILKFDNSSPCIPLVLKGLARFSLLINVELLLDLLQFLKKFVNPARAGTPLSVESSLHCVITALTILQGQGEAITTDLKEFYGYLYALLWKFLLPENSVNIPLLLNALHLMFTHKTRQLSIPRVASFCKRLLALALHVPPHFGIAFMHMAHQLFTKYPKTKQLLDTECTATGSFNPEVDDPDQNNVFASTAWEPVVLRHAYHPFLSRYAGVVVANCAANASGSGGGGGGGAANNTPTATSGSSNEAINALRYSPAELLKAYDASQGGFNPPIQQPSGLGNTPMKEGGGDAYHKQQQHQHQQQQGGKKKLSKKKERESIVGKRKALVRALKREDSEFLSKIKHQRKQQQQQQHATDMLTTQQQHAVDA